MKTEEYWMKRVASHSLEIVIWVACSDRSTFKPIWRRTKTKPRGKKSYSQEGPLFLWLSWKSTACLAQSRSSSWTQMKMQEQGDFQLVIHSPGPQGPILTPSHGLRVTISSLHTDPLKSLAGKKSPDSGNCGLSSWLQGRAWTHVCE